MSIAERIRSQRLRLGLTQSELASRAGLKAPTISQYESGLRHPNFEAIRKLAGALGVSPGYLLGEYADVREVTGGYTREEKPLLMLLDRILEAMTPEEQREFIDYGLYLLSKEKKASDLLLLTSLEEYAAHVFVHLNGGVLPVDLGQVLSRLGIELVEAELEGCEGMVVKGENPVFLIASKPADKNRRRFTVATMLGHIILPWHARNFYRVRSSSTLKTDDMSEIEAAQFAAFLLMPRQHLAEDFKLSSISLEYLTRLAAEKYQVSLFALTNCLIDMHPERFSLVQSDGHTIFKTCQGSRPLVEEVHPESIAASFAAQTPSQRETRSGKVKEALWFKDAHEDAFLLEESVFDPEVGAVLTLLTAL